MKKLTGLLALALLFCVSTFAQTGEDRKENTTQELVGTWKIDLRPTPDAEPYFQDLIIVKANEKGLDGKFYGSKIKDALINDSWPKLYFAFTTSDKNNEYYHTGYLADGKLYGVTYCPRRDFTAPWTGTKE